MIYDFDEVIDRKGSNCIKHDGYVNSGKPDGLLSLWVADMDFKAPKEVGEAIKKAAEFNIYGYSEPDGEHYFNAVAGWMKRNHGWEVKKEWLVKSPGIVFAISAAIRAVTAPEDAVFIMEPVYYPFRSMIEKNGRRVVSSSLVNHECHYEVDFDEMEAKIKDEQVKLFILCSPHNPVGRVWTVEELQKMGDICKKYGVIVIADEIHMDFTYQGHTHHVFTTIDENYGDFTIVCTSPSKSFNLAGLQTSNIFIKDADMRAAFRSQIDVTGYDEINTCGLLACEAAYTYGADWLSQLKTYLAANIDFVDDFLKKNSKKLHLIKPEGTYLIWIDCRDLGISNQELKDRVVKDARLWLDDGSMFGEAGKGFERINVACPRRTLEQAMTQLIKIEY